MEDTQQFAQDEREQYEPPAVIELGTVEALTQVRPVCYPSCTY